MNDRNLYDRARNWGLIGAMFIPALLAWIAWPTLYDSLGPEGTAGAVIAAQIGLALWLPDRFAGLVSARVKRSSSLVGLTRAAFSDPPASVVSVVFEDRDFRHLSQSLPRSKWVECKSTGQSAQVSSDITLKVFGALEILRADPVFTPEDLAAARSIAYAAMCKAALGYARHRDFFATADAGALARQVRTAMGRLDP